MSNGEKKTRTKKLKRMKKEDLKQLACDMNKGLVFTDRQIQQPHLMPVVFVPLVFMVGEKKWADQIGLVYEYLDKAGPRAINGMPMFMSMRVVPKEDVPILLEYVQKYREAEIAVK